MLSILSLFFKSVLLLIVALGSLQRFHYLAGVVGVRETSFGLGKVRIVQLGGLVGNGQDCHTGPTGGHRCELGTIENVFVVPALHAVSVWGVDNLARQFIVGSAFDVPLVEGKHDAITNVVVLRHAEVLREKLW